METIDLVENKSTQENSWRVKSWGTERTRLGVRRLRSLESKLCCEGGFVPKSWRESEWVLKGSSVTECLRKGIAVWARGREYSSPSSTGILLLRLTKLLLLHHWIQRNNPSTMSSLTEEMHTQASSGGRFQHVVGAALQDTTMSTAQGGHQPGSSMMVSSMLQLCKGAYYFVNYFH